MFTRMGDGQTDGQAENIMPPAMAIAVVEAHKVTAEET